MKHGLELDSVIKNFNWIFCFEKIDNFRELLNSQHRLFAKIDLSTVHPNTIGTIPAKYWKFPGVSRPTSAPPHFSAPARQIWLSIFEWCKIYVFVVADGRKSELVVVAVEVG